MLPSTKPASTVNTMPALTSTIPSMNIVTSSTSSRKWVTASPAEPDGLAGLGPTAGQLGGEQVGAQERLHVHPCLGPHQRAPVDAVLMRAMSATNAPAAYQ